MRLAVAVAVAGDGFLYALVAAQHGAVLEGVRPPALVLVVQLNTTHTHTGIHTQG
jgi:hypothetical protein